MHKASKLTLALAATLFAGVASAQVTLYGNEGMRGRSVTVNGTAPNLEGSGFNDRASSMVVQRGQWEVCEDSNFRGDCRIVRPGQYPSLAAIGLGNEISSIRPLRGNPRYAYATPAAEPPRYDYYPRHDERLYQANVTAVRAVGGAPEQRCWVERERVNGVGGYSANQIGGAVVGGILGGVLGHQIGGGRGQDVATAVGAVSGAAIGSNVAGGGTGYTQDVQRCETVASNFQPAYWDVTYVFRGQQHRVQLASAPGPTIAVNGNGEPRV
jgi:uncharacterized protein YcfJ